MKETVPLSLRICLALLSWAGANTMGFAGETTAKEETQAPELRFKIYGWIDSGITFNPDDPKDRQNFGRLFTDRSNEFLLNQAVITLERTLPSTLTDFDWGGLAG